MTKYYSLRADCNYPAFREAAEMIEVVQMKPPYMWCYETTTTEEGNNGHFHFYFESDVKKPTLRARITSLTGRGNGCYSLKECDERMPIKYLAYIMKDKYYEKNGIPEDIYQEALQYDEKVKAEMKEKKQKKKNVLQEIEDSYVQYFNENERRTPEDDPWEHTRYLLRFIINYYSETGNKVVRQGSVQGIFDTLRLKHSEGFLHMYEDYMLSRYEPRHVTRI